MSAVAIVINKLLSDSAVKAVVTSGADIKIYPVLVPQGKTPPAIAVHLISTVDHPHLDGPGSYFRSVVQIDSMASTASQAIELGEKVIAALNGTIKASIAGCADVDILIESGSDFTDYDDPVTVVRRLTRFSVWWRRGS